MPEPIVISAIVGLAGCAMALVAALLDKRDSDAMYHQAFTGGWDAAIRGHANMIAYDSTPPPDESDTGMSALARFDSYLDYKKDHPAYDPHVIEAWRAGQRTTDPG